MTTQPTQPDDPGHEGSMALGDHHDVTDHGADGGHGDHAHATADLGPIDSLAWGAGAVGILLGGAVAAAFILANSGVVPA